MTVTIEDTGEHGIREALYAGGPGVETVEIQWRAKEERCAVWFCPGTIERVVDALVGALAPASKGGA